MEPIDANTTDYYTGGPSFRLSNRLFRGVWIVTWALMARWTPPPLYGWRRFLLSLFGAKLGRHVRIYGSTQIWYPPNLIIGDCSSLGPRVNCYNQGKIIVGERTTVSQGAHLCSSTHDFNRRNFQLVLKPITIGNDAWVAADAFIGPGAIVADGCVIGARAVLFGLTEPWTVYRGNPAEPGKLRHLK